jgi:hypothetical protein
MLITDLVMPHLSGWQLAERMAPSRPGMRILFMSGYAEDAISVQSDRRFGAHFLAKPCEPDLFLAAVRRALDAPAGE